MAPESSNLSPRNAGVAGIASRRFFARRALWHTVGLLLAALLAWLIFRGYRQPELLLDFVGMRLC